MPSHYDKYIPAIKKGNRDAGNMQLIKSGKKDRRTREFKERGHIVERYGGTLDRKVGYKGDIKGFTTRFRTDEKGSIPQPKTDVQVEKSGRSFGIRKKKEKKQYLKPGLDRAGGFHKGRRSIVKDRRKAKQMARRQGKLDKIRERSARTGKPMGFKRHKIKSRGKIKLGIKKHKPW